MPQRRRRSERKAFQASLARDGRWHRYASVNERLKRAYQSPMYYTRAAVVPVMCGGSILTMRVRAYSGSDAVIRALGRVRCAGAVALGVEWGPCELTYASSPFFVAPGPTAAPETG